MSVGKKLDIPLVQLKEIASALNKNIIENKSREQLDRIPTDIFIKNFNINRKNFTVTIKDTGIEFDRSKCLYTFNGEVLECDRATENKDFNNSETSVKNNSETKVKDMKNSEIALNKKENKDETLVINKNETIVVIENMKKEVQDFSNIKVELEEMLEWYKKQRNDENIIDIEIPVIKIDSQKFNSELATTRGIKLYPSTFAEFKDFCIKNGQYKMQDLISMALIEYMEKYK